MNSVDRIKWTKNESKRTEISTIYDDDKSSRKIIILIRAFSEMNLSGKHSEFI